MCQQKRSHDSTSFVIIFLGRNIKLDAPRPPLGSYSRSSANRMKKQISEQAGSAVGTTEPERAYLTFEEFTLDIGGHQLVDSAGREVSLTRGEFALLVSLARHPGLVLSRDQLLSSAVGYGGDGYDRSIDVMIWRLRRKIERDPKHPRIIVTVPGTGYKLAVKVRSTAAKPKEAADAPAEDLPPARPRPVERRHITVLACEFVGLAALSSRLDPDDVDAALGAYRRRSSEVAARFGASVTRFSGEGMHCYFGYPEAHEHDAEHAVRAGLAIIDAVAAFSPGIPVDLHARVGIASGLAIVGDLSGGDGDPEMVGQPPMVASRLASLAPRDGTLISAHTRDLVGSLFRYREVSPVMLPDLREPVAAWQVVSETVLESRFSALRDSALSPMVGRDEEMELLLRRWRQAAAGEGRTVLIHGEAGIGKSRVANWLAQHIEPEPHSRLSYQCSPYHRNSAFYPLIEQIERAAAFDSEDPPALRLDKLEAMLSIDGVDRAATAPLLATLLSIPATGRYQPLALGAAQLRRKTVAMLLELVAGLARRRPLLLIFEDVHWADATSIEWLHCAIDLARRMPIMIIITFRPEFDVRWSGLTSVSSLLLGRLEPQHVRAMIKGIARGRELQASVVDRIVDQTDGVPLYVEELTKVVLDAAAAAPPGVGANSAPHHFAIPLTLRDSLMARIDRLGAAREAAQIGAVIGREFSYALLQPLIGRDEPALAQALQGLEQSGLVLRHGAPPEATYTFTHALVQEAAYESLSKGRRRALHGRIAELHCDASPTDVEPEVIAHHFTQAERTEAAAEWWGKAGYRALSRSASVEAISHFGKALVLAKDLISGPGRLRLLLHLHIGYGHALIPTCGPGSPETTAAFVRARELAAGIENGAERLSALYGLWVGSFCRAELGPIQELAERFACDVESSPELQEAQVVAQRLLGVTAWFHGNYPQALVHLERSVAIYDRARHGSFSFRFGFDAGVSAIVYLALVLWTLGRTREARRQMEAARSLATECGHVPTTAHLLAHECALACISADPQAARAPAQAVIDLSRQHGLPLWLVAGTFCLGWASYHAGDRKIGLTLMRDGMALCQEQGAIYMPNYVFLRAEAEALSGDVETGIGLIVDQLAEISGSGQRWLEAELHRRHAQLLLQRAPADETAAEGAFTRALGIARAQQARMFELRAAIGLARLYRSQRRFDAARDLLAPVRTTWGEDFEVPEVQEAERILRSLDSAS
jgi:class 3 adenylate cyclase/predicted ATPase